MTPKQVREIVPLIREYFRLQAEVRSLAAILEGAVQGHQPPWAWREALKPLRLTQSYRNISEQYALELAHIEQVADEHELRRVMEALPPVHPIPE